MFRSSAALWLTLLLSWISCDDLYAHTIWLDQPDLSIATMPKPIQLYVGSKVLTVDIRI